jgi:hypothetical protein
MNLKKQQFNPQFTQMSADKAAHIDAWAFGTTRSLRFGARGGCVDRVEVRDAKR